jgi:hypothetical protein
MQFKGKFPPRARTGYARGPALDGTQNVAQTHVESNFAKGAGFSVTGTEESRAKVGVSLADICDGMHANSGILTSPLQRTTTGPRDVLEVSMLAAPGSGGQPYFYTDTSGPSFARTCCAIASLPMTPVLPGMCSRLRTVLRDRHECASRPQPSRRNRWRDVDSPVGPLRILIPPATS